MIRFLESALDVVGAAATATGWRFGDLFWRCWDRLEVKCSMCWRTVASQVGIYKVISSEVYI